MTAVRSFLFSFTALIIVTLASHSLLASHAQAKSPQSNPGLKSASALVTDSHGNIIYGKDIDTVRSIASITKLMTAMVILDAGLDLDEKITITKDDRDLIRLTGSRLEYGAKLSRRELLQLALMSSENRAATALGRSYPGGMPLFIAQMNIKATQLDMLQKLKMRITVSADNRVANITGHCTCADVAWPKRKRPTRIAR